MPNDQLWHRQISLDLVGGMHKLSLQRIAADFPHVRRLALLPIAQAVPSELAHAVLEQRIADHTMTLTATDIDLLIRNVTPSLRRLFALRRPLNSVLPLLREITTAVAADVAAPQDRISFSGPFNGQRQRQAIFNRLDAVFRFDAMIETGAYRGTTTEMLAGLGRPVFACEIVREYYFRAAVRLVDYPNVRLSNSDSRSFLRDLFNSRPGWVMPFFYLDAHWGEELVLPEELSLIVSMPARICGFVDDFQHPDPGYGYDRYPQGAELTLDYLLPRLHLPRPLAFWCHRLRPPPKLAPVAAH